MKVKQSHFILSSRLLCILYVISYICIILTYIVIYNFICNFYFIFILYIILCYNLAKNLSTKMTTIKSMRSKISRSESALPQKNLQLSLYYAANCKCRDTNHARSAICLGSCNRKFAWNDCRKSRSKLRHYGK